MVEIKAIIQTFMLEEVLHVLAPMKELPGVTISEVRGWGRSRAADSKTRIPEGRHMVVPKVKLEIVLEDEDAMAVAEAIATAAHTGRPGDGKIFIQRVDQVISVRGAGEGGRND